MGFSTADIIAMIGLGATVGTTAYQLTNQPKMPTIPPPPGAAMISPAGTQAAADTRRRQAAAGGLQSTIFAGGQPGNPATFTGAAGPTSGAKQLTGQ